MGERISWQTKAQRVHQRTHRDLCWKSRPTQKVSIRARRTGDQGEGQHSQISPHNRNHDRGITTNASAEPEKMPPLPVAKLIVLAGCVSLLAALFLAARPDFQPDIVSFQARVGMFMVRYTMPISFFQLGVFWILYLIRKR
jgi:hypothetical protein